MSKDLYYTIPKFIEQKLDKHSNISSWQKIENNDYFIYQISRYSPRDTIQLLLADNYRFTDFDYQNIPDFLNTGDFILVAKPEGGETVSAELIDASKIGVGKLAKFLGALNSRNMWEYPPPEQ